MIIKHPTLPITKDIPEGKWLLWAASGWKRADESETPAPMKKAVPAKKTTPRKRATPRPKA